MLEKPCPVCGEPTANALTSLIWPRCKVCGSKFRVRGFGIGAAAHYLGTVVLVGSLAVAYVREDPGIFTAGFVAFVVLNVVLFRVGRLEPNSRDPVTALQLRRHAGRKGRDA